MRKLSLLVAMLVAMFTTNIMAQTNYYVSHGANVNISHTAHYPKAINIYGTESPVQLLDNIASAPGCAAYFDKTSTIFEVRAGETVTPNISINGEWMHGYVYVDWNNNGQFDVDVTGTGPYTKGANNELMCWSLYSHSSNGDTGYNSDGVYQANGNVLSPGSFVVPAGLTVGSTFRMRYKVEWNSIDPAGTAGNKFITDGGSIIDVTLKIVASNGGTTNTDPKYPINDYTEPRVSTSPNTSEWQAIEDGLIATWASHDVHYKLHEVPEVTKRVKDTIYAWQGERANIQALLYSKTDQGNLSVRMTKWKRGRTTTSINSAEARFVNYVITDDYKQCGAHPINLTPWLVADVIDQDKPHAVPAMETRPVWCKIEVPRNIAAALYSTKLEIVDEDNNVVKSLDLYINVNSRSLPEVKDQKFHLDFWQQPYAVSRYYQVERWSDAHIEALRPYLEALGKAGQKTVSAIMFYEPWGDQSHDKFDPMIQTTKKSNGTWSYDYTIFDKYVELCAEYGIDKQINCFSMVPWDMSFRYWDEATSSYKTISTTTGTTTYQNLWTNFLTAFKSHLQSKGWFEKTNIAMDERSESDMLNAYNIASGLGFNMALAGNYHSSLSDKLQDFCVALGQDKSFTAAQRADRKSKNRITTIYTSCADVEPNIYSNSLPAEATFLPIYAAANDLSGYLHWSWMNWAEDPLKDTRFRLFGAGDTYCYYPGNRSSVRFERLVEGIHQYEKIQILKEEYQNDSEKLATLNSLLARFVSSSVSGEECAKYVNDLEDFLNGKEVEIPTPKDVTTGYYHIVSRATARTENIYNDAFLSGNTKKFTLQSNSKVTTNNGIWHVTVNGNKLGIKNGDGNNLIAGASNYGNVLGNFSQLTIGSTYDVGEYRYYFFTEALNCSNGETNFKINGVDYVTTWTDGPATADDQQWRFEPVNMDGKSAYTVSISGNSNAYVTYTHGSVTEKAFNGGFFIAPNNVSASAFNVVVPNEVVISADIQLNGTTINVSNITLMEEPVKQDLFNTSNGSMGIPPYRIPGIAKTKTGRLIAVAARLVCGTDPGFGQVDVVCRTSDNNGQTWSNIKDVAIGTGITSATYNYFDTAFGDPAVVADRTSNEVAIIVVAGCTYYPSSNTTRQNPNMIGIIYSTDNGNTWGTPVDITEQVYSLFDNGNPIEAAFVAGGKVFQSRIVKKGQYYRLYAAMCARPNGNRVIYSDDFGRTWHALGGEYALPVPNGNEPKCEELPDGRVIVSSRVAGGGRLYNIYTYTNTMTGEGSWSTDLKCTFSGSGRTPGSNDTNGEILVVPVKRNSDNKEMYLALQSLPTGNSRTNVTIFYKELTDFTDYNTVANFVTGWDGYFEVSSTESAYSSMDLQADNKIGFIYEETLTKHGTMQNPVSTSFPTGAGTHNYDGFDNKYVGYHLEYITNGAYSVKTDVNRGNIVKSYLTSLVAQADISSDLRAEVNSAIQALGADPTPAEIDNIYSLLQGQLLGDPLDGKVVTLTNVQQNGNEYSLYISTSKTLEVSNMSATTLGNSAMFECRKKDNGKYTFYNKDAEVYMIWRAGNNYGYNNNKGTLPTYYATYCDWSVNDASSTKANTYYMASKRDGGTTDGTLVVMSATGTFDSWDNSVAWAANYSNLYRIDVLGTITGVKEVTTESKWGSTIYDLNGRIITNPTTNGIYIVNGKKVFINEQTFNMK